MRPINIVTVLVVFCFVFTVLLSGCSAKLSKDDLDKTSTKDHYRMEDFQTIIVGESTHQDVYKIGPTGAIQVTSYGGFCEYPMQNGGYIRIKFYGPDLVVGAIEEIEQPEGDG